MVRFLFIVHARSAARARAEEGAHRSRVEALSHEKREESAIFGGIADGAGPMTDATGQCTCQQLRLIHIFEDCTHRAAGHLPIDALRLEPAQHTHPAMTIDERVRARGGQRRTAIVERTAVPELCQHIVDGLGRDLPRSQALPNLKLTQLAKGQPFQGKSIRVWRRGLHCRLPNTEYRGFVLVRYSPFGLSVFLLSHRPNLVTAASDGSPPPLKAFAMSSLAISDVIEIPWTFSLNSLTLEHQRSASS